MSNSLVEYNSKGQTGQNAQSQANMQAYGHFVYFQKNSTLRLMYYLSSVAQVLPNLKDPTFLRLTCYKNFTSLTHEDKQLLLKWCVACAPEHLIDRVFFFNESLYSKNIFYKVSENSAPLHVNINGNEIEVTNIMHLKRIWIKDFYVQPLQDLIGEIYKPTLAKTGVCTII
jgi:hypothetical protein